jgi:cytochrome P450
MIFGDFFSIMRSSDNWKDADKFVPERWFEPEAASKEKDVFVPFGLGPRSCPGIGVYTSHGDCIGDSE